MSTTEISTISKFAARPAAPVERIRKAFGVAVNAKTVDRIPTKAADILPALVHSRTVSVDFVVADTATDEITRCLATFLAPIESSHDKDAIQEAVRNAALLLSLAAEPARVTIGEKEPTKAMHQRGISDYVVRVSSAAKDKACEWIFGLVEGDDPSLLNVACALGCADWRKANAKRAAAQEHNRKAVKEIRTDGMTDEQRKAYEAFLATPK